MEDHPRIRGEHIGAVHTHRLLAGSSPHTRGARPVLWGVSGRAGIIPAYAGSTSLYWLRESPTADHPRIRGEHPDNLKNLEKIKRIIPAYAGSTA